MDGSSAPVLTDPVGFVRALEPFRALGPEHLALLSRELEVVFVPGGSRVLSHGGAPAAHLHVVRKGTALLSRDGAPILTDRDLRDRVLAEGHGPDTPAEKVASRPIVSVPAETPVADAQVAMLDRGIHHLGVERDGRLVGIVTTGDLLRHHPASPLHVQRWLGTVERAELPRTIDELHAVIGVLVTGGLGPLEVARTLSSLTDTLTRRVIELVGTELGPPPGPYAWLALGSDARREQTLYSDQDHALVHAEVADGDAAWFHELAAEVTDLLETAGLPRCPGGTMATRWCDPLPVWQHRFDRWLAEPDVQALYETGIFLDHRVVAGDLDVAALDAIVRRRRGDAVLLARLASAASTARPPVGLFHRLREDHEGRVDLKAGGLVPIADLARVLAVEVGSDARSTVERLAVARDLGALSDEGAEELTEAFGFLLGMRLRAQVAARRAGTDPTTLVRVDDLAPGARRHLKEAFVAIARIQEVTVQRLGGSEVAR